MTKVSAARQGHPSYANAGTNRPRLSRPIQVGDLPSEVALDTDVVTDHGALTGLADDDHTQYTKADGSRAFTGDQSFGSNKILSPSSIEQSNVKGTETELTNDATLTTMYSHTVPADSMGGNGYVEVVFMGDVLRNAAGNLRLQITWDGNTIYDDSIGWSASSTLRNPVYLRFRIYNQNSVTSQGLTGYFCIGTAGGATTGIGNIDQDEVESAGSIGADHSTWTGDADTESSAVVVAVNWKWTIADTNLSLKRLHASTEVRYAA